MKTYKTSEKDRLRAKIKREAVKSAGGADYAALLVKERNARAAYRKRHPEKLRSERKRNEKTQPGWHKRRLVMAARRRGRQRGLESTIRVSDLAWPTHCPVLGITLDYTTKSGFRNGNGHNNPSLDRFDCQQGYVPGNVMVISFRANALKSNATLEELEAVIRYMRLGACTLMLEDA